MYAGLYKLSCDMCGRMGERPKKTVIHKDGSRADICECCYQKCLNYPKFTQGVQDEEIKIIDF